jgi:hypothetical protein
MIRATTAGFVLSFLFGEFMIGRYKNENEIYGLLRSFEDATVSRDEWKHAEHMVVALCYLEEHDLAPATDKMRAGIMNLLTTGFGVDLSKEMPYHETLTVFWMRAVYAYSLVHKEKSLVEKANGLIESYDKDHPMKFYTRDRLFSGEARDRFIEPDLTVGLTSA